MSSSPILPATAPLVLEAAGRLGPTIRKGQSYQGYRTPPEFLFAVEKRFGKIEFDLAATAGANVLGVPHFGPGSDLGEDALAQQWPADKLCWLNPPFDPMRPWSRRCKWLAQRGGRVLLLSPYVCADWWRFDCWPHCRTLALTPRIKFIGESHGYPKDLQLCVFGFGLAGFDVWRWKN